MYLSVLTLNGRSKDARRDVENGYQMHSTLARLFADGPGVEREQRAKAPGEGEKERVLFRIEPATAERGARVIVQSQYAPNFLRLPNGYCSEPPQTRDDYGPKLTALTVGQTLRFRLRANPTVKRDGKRLGLREEGEQRVWLGRKLREAGAELLACRIAPHEVVTGRKHGAMEQGSAPMQIHLSVLFEGVLRIIDAAALRAAITCGIGPAKGYGFGLLSLAPA